MEILDASKVIESFGLAYFHDLSTFGALSDEVIVDLLKRGTIKRFKKGEYIDRYGEVADDFQVVLQGEGSILQTLRGVRCPDPLF